MIYTCTLNPSIDYVAKVNRFQEGTLNRTNSVSYFPGGKGINVSRVLQRLEIQSTVLGFSGGFTGQFIKDFLTLEGVRQQMIEIDDITRINVKLKSNKETEINGEGPAVSPQNQEDLIRQLEALNHEDILILSGSVPKTMSESFYATALKRVQDKGLKVVVDTTGAAFQETLAYQPFLVKPNHHELGEFFNTDISSIEDAIFYGKKLLDKGVQNVIVSMAGQGALFLNNELVLHANVPKGVVRNSVGAGDSVIAGFLSQIEKGQDLIEAFRFGVASGSATAFSEDLCEKSLVEQLLSEVRVKS